MQPLPAWIECFHQIVGRRETKPTVSTSSTAMPLGRTSFRLVGSRVAKSISASATLGPQRGVHQAGFAHVGAAGEAQLRAVALGQLAGNAVACNEIRFVIVHGAFLSLINAIYPNSFSHRLRDASSLSEGASSEEEKLSGMPKPPSLREVARRQA